MSLIRICEVGVSGNIDRNIVIVDGIAHEPVPAGVPVRKQFFSPSLAFCYVLHTVGSGYSDEHSGGFFGLVIFFGPPEAGAGSLAGNRYPWFAIFTCLPNKPTVPGRAVSRYRRPRIKEPESAPGAFPDGFRKVDEHRVILPLPGKRMSFPQNAVNLHVLKQIHLNAIETVSGPERSEEHTSELQSLMRTSYAALFLKKTSKQN